MLQVYILPLTSKLWSLTSDILRSCPCEFRCSKPNSIDVHTIPYNSILYNLHNTNCTRLCKKNRGASNFPETARMDTPKTEFDARKQQKLTKQLAPYWSFTTQLEFGGAIHTYLWPSVCALGVAFACAFGHSETLLQSFKGFKGFRVLGVVGVLVVLRVLRV